MKTPLPRDFEVSYDVVAAQNYRWGARGLTLKLSRTPAAGTGSRSSACESVPVSAEGKARS